MDIRLPEALPAADEVAAVDAVLGPPASAWEGGERGSARDAHTAFVGGKASREQRHLLLPALQALQGRIGWISEGGMGYVCERLNVPPAEAWGVATFYALLATSPHSRRVLHVCDDIACRARGARGLCHELESDVGTPVKHGPSGDVIDLDDHASSWMHSPCLGMCDQAPAAFLAVAGEKLEERSLGAIDLHTATRVLEGETPVDTAAVPSVYPLDFEGSLLARVGKVSPVSLDAYRRAGGYDALNRAFQWGPGGVIAQVNDAKLVGRGGAVFPTGRKWEAVRSQADTPHYLVCNADESEPGTFKDRVLLTEDPFAIVEAMTIAAYATGCNKGFVYMRAEYPLAFERMTNAITQARSAGLLGKDILGKKFGFDIEIRRGAGAYICGEETAIFESIEGKRGEPRNKPPFPITHGVFGKPTVVNNVETLANVIPIMRFGAESYASRGSGGSRGTRLFCLSGNVQKPGVYEVELGTTLGDLVARAGGVTEGRRLQAMLLGGAAGMFVGPDMIDLHLTHEDTRAAGVTLGSGVVMLFDDTIDMQDIVLRIAAFFRDESCGQCVPCRVGTVRQEEALHRIASRKTIGSVNDELALLKDVGIAMRDGSICGLGQTAYSAVESAITRLGMFGGAR